MAFIGIENLPEEFALAIENDEYSKGDADISVTTLIDSPLIARLRRENPDDIEQSAADKVIAMYGTGIHAVLEKQLANIDGVISERRMSIQVSGKKISGQIDKMVNLGRNKWELVDYKVVRAVALQEGSSIRESWAKQLNCYATIAEANGFEVEGLAVTAIIRDWYNGGAKYKSGYPEMPVAVIPVPLWSASERIQYMKGRVSVHFANTQSCTDGERWARREEYAVYEYGKESSKLRARATRIFGSPIDAGSFLHDNRLRGEVVERGGGFIRCEGNYCGVSRICPQWAGGNEKGKVNGK